MPLFQRKTELKKIVLGTEIQFSEGFGVEGREMFARACKIGLEGVVSKVRDSVYASGRGNNWVKKTCALRDLVLPASRWTKENGTGSTSAGKGVRTCPRREHGFDKVSASDLQKRLKPLIRKTQPYSKRIAHKGIWVEPKLLAEVEYRANSAEGKVPHPFF
ncbi:ATP-dependent DNA ligase [Bradyrhizobium japonicum]|uniref:DNA ligase (ATP) n=1 Tax=Bradyrhizobium japonicum TaxID=375 RepID=A0ABV2RJU7_BRAJP